MTPPQNTEAHSWYTALSNEREIGQHLIRKAWAFMKDASFKKYLFMATNITGSEFYVGDSLNQCR